jgi:pSer/pThr/pTyr-binding forkhead associated (FHA) protein
MATTGVPRLTSPTGSYELAEGENLIGREDGLPISLPGESTVSRRHAALVLTGGMAIVRDLGSTNGTFVNGMKVTAEASVRPGDELQVGAIRLRFES